LTVFRERLSGFLFCRINLAKVIDTAICRGLVTHSYEIGDDDNNDESEKRQQTIAVIILAAGNFACGLLIQLVQTPRCKFRCNRI
jgi:hypothetical protein